MVAGVYSDYIIDNRKLMMPQQLTGSRNCVKQNHKSWRRVPKWPLERPRKPLRRQPQDNYYDGGLSDVSNAYTLLTKNTMHANRTLSLYKMACHPGRRPLHLCLKAAAEN